MRRRPRSPRDDGDHHASQVEADERRTAAMEREGWRVLRFWANHVVQNPEGVSTEIALVLGDGGQPPPPTSPPSGGEDAATDHPSYRARRPFAPHSPAGGDAAPRR